MVDESYYSAVAFIPGDGGPPDKAGTLGWASLAVAGLVWLTFWPKGTPD